VQYTRAGSLITNPQGQLVTQDGMPVEPQITIPQGVTSVNIGSDGTVSVTLPGSSETQEVGRMELASFTNPGGLQAGGRGLYRATAASGQPIVAPPGEEGNGLLSQGMLENSNVEVVTEMIDLIASQRAYEINQRVITASDEMLRKTTDM
jgi:flagellar basal-body rod protein FlgG